MQVWRLKTQTLTLAAPRLMGILNATPDSFSDGGQFDANANAVDRRKTASAFRVDLNALVDKGLRLVRDGATILDVGGESARPGAEPVDEAEELRRVVPAIHALKRATDVPISVDSYRPAVADAALEAGAEIVNDVSAGRFIASENRFADENESDFPEETLEVVRRRGAAIALTHTRGTPKTTHTLPAYSGDVVSEIIEFLKRRRDKALELGIEKARIAVDPGVGFGETFEQNWEIVRRAAEFSALGQPVFFGCSRKRFLIETLRRVEAARDGDRSDVDLQTVESERFREPLNPNDLARRDDATAIVSALLARRGVRIIRVHNVLKSALALEAAGLAGDFGAESAGFVDPFIENFGPGSAAR